MRRIEKGEYKYRLIPKNKKFYKWLHCWFFYIQRNNIWGSKSNDTIPTSPNEIKTINQWLKGNIGTKYHDLGSKIDLGESEGKDVWRKYHIEFNFINSSLEDHQTQYYNNRERRVMSFYRDLFKYLNEEPPYRDVWKKISTPKEFRTFLYD